MDVIFRHDGLEPVSEFFEEHVELLARAIGAVLADGGLPVPQLTVITTPDVVAAAALEYEALGLPGERRSGAERVGGAVGGKCIVSDDLAQGSIILTDRVVVSDEGLAALNSINAAAHELCHLVYSTARTAEIGVATNAYYPWDIAGRIAVIAAEEHRVERLANEMTERLLGPTDETGDLFDFCRSLRSDRVGFMPETLNHVSPGLEETIEAYRIGPLSLDEMWAELVRVSEGIAIYFAMTEAHNRTEDEITAGIEHAALQLVEPWWRPLRDHLRATSGLVPHDWTADRERLHQLGTEGLTDFWRRLGVTSSPLPDGGFHLAVGPPTT